MSTAEASPKRICQVCGHANSGLSLFCAECGSVLNMEPDNEWKTPLTVEHVPDTQETQAFSPTPADPDDERWSAAATSGHDPQSTAPYLPAAREPVARAEIGATETAEVATPVEALPPTSAPWAASADAAELHTDAEPRESLRGFFFGVVAIVLILVVAAIYSWTIIPNGSLRDTIQGWIDSVSI